MQAGVLERLADLTSCLLGGADLDECLRRVASTALELVPADHASVRLQVGEELRVRARVGVGAMGPEPRFRRGEGLLGWVAETGRVVRLHDAPGDPRFIAVPDNPVAVRSLIGVPIHFDGDTAGVLTLCSERVSAFDSGDEAVSMLLANVVAQALRAQRLQELAITDSTTGAYNHRCLLPRLEEEMERAARHENPLSILLMDLDHFKQVNDRFGHGVGDDVLKAFTHQVRAAVRSIDLLVRRGGEEFVLIMPATDAERAAMVAERICDRVRDQPLRARHGTEIAQTVSIGVATWDGEETAQSLDDRADQAMYDAKHDGRDRASVAPRVSTVRRRSPDSEAPADDRTAHTARTVG